MSETARRARFEALAVPLINDALGLAAWLASSRTDAEDIVQEAMLRAYKYFDRFSGSAFRPWLLAIVRNTAMTWLKRNRSGRMVFVPDLPEAFVETPAEPIVSPEAAMMNRDLSKQINQAVANLAPEFREVIVLRELHDLSYKEIAAVIEIPIGTVMSRLSRARRLLMDALPEASS